MSTVFAEARVLNPLPVIVTNVPAGPLVGLKLVIVGGTSTEKLAAVVVLNAPMVTEILPVEAPAGTVVVIVVAVELVTTAGVPLKLTTLLDALALKLVPVIVTVVPATPALGLNPVMTGGIVTVKLDELTAVILFTVTETAPVEAPDGTTTVSAVADAAVTTAETPPIVTELFEVVGLKLAPVMVTEVPAGPLAGAKLEMFGGMRTVKTDGLVAVNELTVTVIDPVVAPIGTVVLIVVAVAAVTTAAVPLNATALLLAVAEK